MWNPSNLAQIWGSRKNAPEPREYQIGFIYFMHTTNLVQLLFPPKLVQVARQAGEAGSMSVAEMALGASNPSQRMVYSIWYLQDCVLVCLCA